MEIIVISALWCPSCLVMKKIYKELEISYPMVKFNFLDYDFDEEIVKTYNVSNKLPVLVIKKNDLEIKRIVGEHSLEDYKIVIKECLDEI